MGESALAQSQPTEEQLENRRLLQESLADWCKKSNPNNLVGFYSYTRSRDLDIVSPDKKVDEILEMIRQKLQTSSSVELHVTYIKPETNNAYHRGFRWTLDCITNDMRSHLLRVFENFDSFNINLLYYSPKESR